MHADDTNYTVVKNGLVVGFWWRWSLALPPHTRRRTAGEGSLGEAQAGVAGGVRYLRNRPIPSELKSALARDQSGARGDHVLRGTVEGSTERRFKVLLADPEQLANPDIAKIVMRHLR
jgi:hypothetical protein